MADDEPAVTATTPESPIHLAGTDHVTLVDGNEADTIAFYRDLLGMPLVLRQPNLDRPAVTHLLFDTGDGRIVTFFVHEDRDADDEPLEPDVGAVHHLAFSVDPARFAETVEALEDAGRPVFDRGVLHSLYTRDHNGLTIELATDEYDVPDERRGEVLATAQRRREADGADYAKEEHLVAASRSSASPPTETTSRPSPPTPGATETEPRPILPRRKCSRQLPERTVMESAFHGRWPRSVER